MPPDTITLVTDAEEVSCGDISLSETDLTKAIAPHYHR
jgi:hypothetical protein